MHALIAIFLSDLVRQTLFFAIALGAMTALELLLPREPGFQASRGQGVVFWILWVPCSAATFSAFTLIWQSMGWRPAISVQLAAALGRLGPLRFVLAPLLTAVVGDFFFYWFHRAQHAFFWPLHAVHHSIDDLNAANSYHHVTEELMRILLYTLPMSCLSLDFGKSLPALSLLFSLQPVFIHCPTRLHLGPLRTVFAGPGFHRIHHSIERNHHDKNFGAITTLWDVIFGTAYIPRHDEWPRTGIEGIAAPRSVRAWLTLPLKVLEQERHGMSAEMSS